MKVTALSHEADFARLWGPAASLEVESPLEGVFRLRHAPTSGTSSLLHPALPAKRSWAVLPQQRRLLEVMQEDARVTVRADELQLSLGLGELSWTLFGPDGATLARLERVMGEAIPSYPATHYRSAFSLHAPPGEAYVGFGEKTGPLDKRGLKFKFWNTDVLPHQPDTDPLYVSIPFFMALREGVAWGLFLDESWRSEVDVCFSDAERLTWASTGPELDLYVIQGPHPTQVLDRYTRLTGRPLMPPLWALGAHQSRWGYETAEEILSVIEGYRRRGLPLDCVHLDIDHQDGYRSLTWDRSRFPQPRAVAEQARNRGVRLVPIVDPGLLAVDGNPLYEEAKAKDALVRTDRGHPFVGEVWANPAVFPDFTQAHVQDWWADSHRPFLDDGMAGFWNDMNEPSCFSVTPQHALTPKYMSVGDVGHVEGKTLPDETRHGPRRHLEVHNVYALGMAKATFEGIRRHRPEARPFVLTRAGYAGIQRYAAVWTGDNSSHWGHVELSIAMLLGLGVSGVGFTGADIPGFIGQPSSELFIRWGQLGVFYPLMRNHSAKGVPFQEPWRHGDQVLACVKASLEHRYRLLPTLYTLMEEATRTGTPPLRPLFFHEPSTHEALHAFDQFLFGPDLLVAPVVRPGQRKRLAYLPSGRWLPWSNFQPSDREPQPPFVEGPAHAIADAPLDVVPLWLRAGGGIALTQRMLHTDTANWAQLEWHLFPDVNDGPCLRVQLYEDEGDGSGPFRRTTIGATRDAGILTLTRHVEGALAPARGREILRLHAVPAPTSVSGAAASRWNGGVLELEVPADWASVTVR